MHGVATEFSLEDMCRLSYRSVCVHPCMAAGASGLVASPSATYHTVLCKSGRHGTRTRIARTTGSAGTTDALALPVRARTKAIFIVSSRTYSSPVQAIGQTRTLCICPCRFPPPQNGKSRRASSPSACLLCVCQCHLAILHAAYYCPCTRPKSVNVPLPWLHAQLPFCRAHVHAALLVLNRALNGRTKSKQNILLGLAAARRGPSSA